MHFNVNCKHFKAPHNCTSKYAPRGFFAATCVLVFPRGDQRFLPGCAVQEKHPRPTQVLSGPPNTTGWMFDVRRR